MRIAVVGAQNVGKTTFIKDFVAKFPSYTTPNVSYRDVVKEKGLKINQETNAESQEAIMDFIYKLISESRVENIIFDRCLIDNYVYSYCAHLKGNISKDFINSSKEKMKEHLKYLDIIIFIPVSLNVNLEPDQLRDTDKNFVDLVNKTFVDTLFELIENKTTKVVVISGAREERLEEISRKIFGSL
jgi:GTPase SAR1 family protein